MKNLSLTELLLLRIYFKDKLHYEIGSAKVITDISTSLKSVTAHKLECVHKEIEDRVSKIEFPPKEENV